MKFVAVHPIAIVVVVAATTVVEAVAVSLDLNTIILAVIGLIGTCVTGFLALRMATLAAAQKEQKVAQDGAAEAMKEIHTAVNSAKTALETKLEDFTKQNVELAKKVATLEENKRGAELAKAIASVPPVVVAPVSLAPAAVAVPVAAPAPSKDPVTVATTVTPAEGAPSKLKDAITDLTETAKQKVADADDK